jgi:hypothetical protein
METSGAEDIGVTRVLVSWHFGHSKVCESKPGLSGSMIRNDMVSPHFEQRGLLIPAANIAHPPYQVCPTFVMSRGERINGTALRKSCVRNMTDVCKVTSVAQRPRTSSLENEICTMFVRTGTKSHAGIWRDAVTLRRHF